MRKVGLLVVLVLFIIVPSSAFGKPGSRIPRRKVSLQLQGGLNMFWSPCFKEERRSTATEKFKTKRIFLFTPLIRFTTGYRPCKKWGFSGGVVLSSLGLGVESIERYLAGRVELEKQYQIIKTKGDYVGIPLCISFFPWSNKEFVLKGGIQCSILYREVFYKRKKIRTRKSFYKKYPTTKMVRKKGQCYLNDFEIATLIGMAYEWGYGFVLEGRYQLGLTNLFKGKRPKGNHFFKGRGQSFHLSMGINLMKTF